MTNTIEMNTASTSRRWTAPALGTVGNDQFLALSLVGGATQLGSIRNHIGRVSAAEVTDADHFRSNGCFLP